MEDDSKWLAFCGDWRARQYLAGLPKETAKQLREEIALVNCSTCFDRECNYRDKQARIPQGAGGESQCLRWARAQSPFCWRDGQGRVIIIPDEVIQAIRNE